MLGPELAVQIDVNKNLATARTPATYGDHELSSARYNRKTQWIEEEETAPPSPL
jgi:hypothetical protein